MMTTVTKYAQSCFLFQKNERRVLVDPGRFDVDLHGRKPADWPTIHGLLLTHEHFDHAHLPTLTFLSQRDRCPVYTNASFALQLQHHGVRATALDPGQSVDLAGFRVLGVAQHHGDLPGRGPGPENMGFVIDGTFYTTGDSVPLETMSSAPVLLVPVAGPQMNFETARRMVEIVKPKFAIAMHYANVANYPIDLNELRALRFPGTELVVLDDGQTVRWDRDSQTMLR